jgi:hypothetical protein
MKRLGPQRRCTRREEDEDFDERPRRIIRVGDRERRSFKKDLWPADTEFEDVVANLQQAWRHHRSLGGRRSRTERLAWADLIEFCLQGAELDD